MRKKSRNPWEFDPDHLTWPYVFGVPIAFLAAAAIGIMAGDFIRWGGLVLYTMLVFGFFINDSRWFFGQRRFWFLASTLLVIHIAVFITILLHVHHWRVLWFNVMVVEIPPFLSLRDVVLRDVVSE